MRNSVPALVVILLLSSIATASAAPPRAELAGLRLGMSEEQARETLARHGKPLRGKGEESERGEQESWSLDRGPWAFVAFGIDGERLRWITAFARRAGPHIRYRDIGSLADSKRSGFYFFTWKVPAARGRSPYLVIARGTDSTYVTSVSLLRDEREASRSGAAVPDDAR